jgi:putative ABC transport system permease protein
MLIEAGVLALGGVLAGTALTYLVIFLGRAALESRFGIFVLLSAPDAYELKVLSAIVLAALAMGLFPALRAYRNTLSDGLQVRI